METYGKSRTHCYQLQYHIINPFLNLHPQRSRHAYLVTNRRHDPIHTQIFPTSSVFLEHFAQQLDRYTSLIFVLVERTLLTTSLGPAPRVGRQNDVVWMHVDVAHLVVRLELDCDVVVFQYIITNRLSFVITKVCTRD